jgi:hypothetical protein
MSTARAAAPAEQAPGVVKIRLSGSARDIAAVAGLDLIEISPPYPNRRDAGERVYLTVRVTTTITPRGASAQPPSNSPAPRSLKGGPSHDDH